MLGYAGGIAREHTVQPYRPGVVGLVLDMNPIWEDLRRRVHWSALHPHSESPSGLPASHRYTEKNLPNLESHVFSTRNLTLAALC